MMSDSSFLDKPLLKVSRPVAACSRCRTAKIKCDGKLPACSACERAGKTDTCSSSDEFPRGKERSYVGSLEAYCERLEKRTAELRQRKALLVGGEEGVIHESSITSSSSTGRIPQAHRQEVSNIDDLVGDFGYLSVSATSRDFQGITSNTSFANLLLSVSLGEQIPRSSPQPLPSRSEITPLAQHYFDIFFTQLPFFFETTFWASVDSVYQNGAHFARPFDNWILRMVLATAYASMSNVSNDSNHQRALSLVSDALQYAEDVLLPGTLMGIQAIMLFAQYSLVDPTHFRAWYLIGMAARVLVDLGLHQDHHSESIPSTEQKDLRRRVFHCLYSLDRATSAALDRTFSFSDDSANVALPSYSSAADYSHIFSRNLDPAWNIVRIRRLLSEAYQKRYSTEFISSFQTPASTWELASQASEWYNTLPKSASAFYPTIYRLEYLYTTIIILSPSSYHVPHCNYTKLLLFNRCIDYIREIHQILQNRTWVPIITFLDIQRIYQVSRRLIHIVTQDSDLLVSLIPAIPQVPHDCPSPPLLECEDYLQYHERAAECLNQVENLLNHGARKWKLHNLLQDFRRISSPAREQSLSPAASYTTSIGTYLSEGPAIMAFPDVQYTSYSFDSSPEHFN
ncbi:fungal-specific transcription factor domain-containing protein [Aspergillus pseudodeflectus]|uniref:Fungal-specific transcription factor domain-containing protein n=1 Tax=Aspergillus pseudodeflectus TaxID=176178 RepID=A0ABR4KF55_9EURO